MLKSANNKEEYFNGLSDLLDETLSNQNKKTGKFRESPLEANNDNHSGVDSEEDSIKKLEDEILNEED